VPYTPYTNLYGPEGRLISKGVLERVATTKSNFTTEMLRYVAMEQQSACFRSQTTSRPRFNVTQRAVNAASSLRRLLDRILLLLIKGRWFLFFNGCEMAPELTR
jgi:hypothetical protein